MGSPSGCRLSPQTHVCRGWTPRLARTSCLHALRAPAPGFAELGGARAKRGYHPCGLASHRPAASAALGAVPPSLDAMACVPSGRTSALRKRTGGSRASRAPGASPPTSYRPAGAGLRCRDAMPFGHPCGAASPLLLGATDEAPPSARPGAGRDCGRLALPPLRGSPQFSPGAFSRKGVDQVSQLRHDRSNGTINPRRPALAEVGIERATPGGPSLPIHRMHMSSNAQRI